MMTNKSDNYNLQVPLNSAQTGIWLYDSFIKSSRNTLCAYANLSGIIYETQFYEACKLLIEKHDIFHIRFNKDKYNTPFQTFTNKKHLHYEFKNLNEQELNQLLVRESKIIMDIYNDELYKFTLAKVKENSYTFVIRIHHIISDELTPRILFDEILSIYCDLLTNKYSQQDNNSSSFIEYCVEKSSRKLNVEYWKNKLLKDIYILDSQNVLSTESKDEKNVQFILPRKGIVELEKKCAELQSTLFMGMITLFLSVLNLTYNKEILFISTSFSDRRKKKYASALGMFVNNQLLKIKIEETDTFETLLKKVRQEIFEVYQYCDFSIDEVLRTIGLSNYSKIQNHVVFTFLGSNHQEKKFKEFKVSPLNYVNKNPNNSLNIYIDMIDNEYHCKINYLENFIDSNKLNYIQNKFMLLLKKEYFNSSLPVQKYFKNQ